MGPMIRSKDNGDRNDLFEVNNTARVAKGQVYDILIKKYDFLKVAEKKIKLYFFKKKISDVASTQF